MGKRYQKCGLYNVLCQICIWISILHTQEKHGCMWMAQNDDRSARSTRPDVHPCALNKRCRRPPPAGSEAPSHPSSRTHLHRHGCCKHQLLLQLRAYLVGMLPSKHDSPSSWPSAISIGGATQPSLAPPSWFFLPVSSQMVAVVQVRRADGR